MHPLVAVIAATASVLTAFGIRRLRRGKDNSLGQTNGTYPSGQPATSAPEAPPPPGVAAGSAQAPARPDNVPPLANRYGAMGDADLDRLWQNRTRIGLTDNEVREVMAERRRRMGIGPDPGATITCKRCFLVVTSCICQKT